MKIFGKICTRATAIIFRIVLLPGLLSAAQPCPEKLHEFVCRMPKTSLHVHLEGSINPNTVIEIANRNGVAVPFKDEEQFRQMCVFPTFNDFVAFYRIIQSCLKKPADYEQIAYEYGKEAARQNICYSEVMVSLDSDCMGSGLTWQQILEALNNGRERAQNEFRISWTWVFANAHPEKISPEIFADGLIKMHNEKDGVVAMAVLEPLFDGPLPVQYQRGYDKAIAAGIPVIPHSGEFQGPQNIKNALAALNKCEGFRIDHGVQCIHDEDLEKYLAQQHIPLDVCITSNICLHAFPDYQHHPVRVLFDAGLLVNVNTDDPAIFCIDLIDEYDHLIVDYNFTLPELEKISMYGILASLISPEEKQTLVQRFESECAKLRQEIFGM